MGCNFVGGCFSCRCRFPSNAVKGEAGISEQRWHTIAPVCCDGLNEPSASLKTMFTLGQKGFTNPVDI